MGDPQALGADDCFSDQTERDEVHAAAGPGNHWFFLVSQGTDGNGQGASPTCNDSTVTGLGIESAMKIMFNAMLLKNSNSSYPQYRVLTLQAAKTLFPGSCKEFDTVLATNTRSLFVMSKAVVPHMAARGGGSIVNIGSITLLIGMANLLPYLTSKGGLMGFTRALAREVGPQNIRANNVSPGAFPTGGETIHPDPEGYSAFVLEQQCLKRRGSPDDLANVVAFCPLPSWEPRYRSAALREMTTFPSRSTRATFRSCACASTKPRACSKCRQ